jgi:hypothetical protein
MPRQLIPKQLLWVQIHEMCYRQWFISSKAKTRGKATNKLALEMEWLMDHVNTQINQVVVMYRSTEQVIRPASPTDVFVWKGIMSCFSVMFLGVPRHYVKRPFCCWWKTCSRAWGQGLGSQSSDPDLLVTVCTCTKQTAWTEDQFTVTAKSGIRNHEKRVVEIVVRDLKRTKPDTWGDGRRRALRWKINKTIIVR